jgi:hypothetical protein
MSEVPTTRAEIASLMGELNNTILKLAAGWEELARQQRREGLEEGRNAFFCPGEPKPSAGTLGERLGEALGFGFSVESVLSQGGEAIRVAHGEDISGRREIVFDIHVVESELLSLYDVFYKNREGLCSLPVSFRQNRGKRVEALAEDIRRFCDWVAEYSFREEGSKAVLAIEDMACELRKALGLSYQVQFQLDGDGNRMFGVSCDDAGLDWRYSFELRSEDFNTLTMKQASRLVPGGRKELPGSLLPRSLPVGDMARAVKSIVSFCAAKPQ